MKRISNFMAGERLGPFTIVRHIGSGWESHVYAARDRRNGALRSLKLFRRRPNVLEDVLHTMAHWKLFSGLETVKQLHEWGWLPEEALAWASFDYIRGVTLASHVANGRVRDPTAIVVQLCEALVPLHLRQLGILDHDNMRNVILERGTGRIVFCDLDAGGPDEAPPSISEDLHELQRAANRMWRAQGMDKDLAVLRRLAGSRNAIDALDALKKLRD